MTKFQKSVIEVVQSIPKGRVVSYGQVALYVGVPRAARQVGWILRGLEGYPELHWWRVINNAGLITIKGNKHQSPETQKKLLEADGVAVSPDLKIDIEAYRFHPDEALLNDFRMSGSYLDKVSAEIPFER